MRAMTNGSKDNSDSGGISFLWEGQEPSQAEIDRVNADNLRRRQNFSIAAEYVARAYSSIPAVHRIVLFGSVAAPPFKERYLRGRNDLTCVEVYHACADIDLAVWIDDVRSIDDLRSARLAALSELLVEKGIGVAHHQVDVFILNYPDGAYLGRLCVFGKCPARKYVCKAEGCGRIKFLRLHQGFAFMMAKLEASHPLCLFPGRGIA